MAEDFQQKPDARKLPEDGNAQSDGTRTSATGVPEDARRSEESRSKLTKKDKKAKKKNKNRALPQNLWVDKCQKHS